MAAQNFDFEAFKALAPNAYKMQYCKQPILKKATGAIFMIDYTLGKAAVKCVMIPFKKYEEARKAFKQLKESKEHPLNKVALAAIEVQTEGNTSKLHVELKKGNLTAEKLLVKSKIFAEKMIKMDLDITIGVVAEEANPAENEATTAETSAPKVTLTEEERSAHRKKLKSITSFFDKLANMS